MNINDVGAKADGILGNFAGNDGIRLEGADAVEATGFPDADKGINLGQIGVFKTGHMLAQTLHKLGQLQMTFDFRTGQIDDVAAVHAQMARAVQMHFAGHKGVDIDQRIAIHRQLALLTQLAKQLAQADEHMVGRSAEEIGIVAFLHFHGRPPHHLLGIVLYEFPQLFQLHAAHRAHQRGRLHLAAVILSLFVARAM